MKKVFMMAMLALAVSFTSCGNKAAQDDPTGATEVIENMRSQLDAGDVTQFQTALQTVKEKVAQLLKENPETAKEYLTKVQNFLKENADKVKAVVGDNEAVSGVVSSLVDMPAESVISNLQNAIGSVQEAGQQAVDDTQEAVEGVANDVKDAAEAQVEEAKQKAADEVNKAADKVNQKVNEGADKLLKGAGLK